MESSVAAQRHLVADASHELRTPIASLRANIQVLEDADRLSPGDLLALRADIIEELDELTALVSDVVELARGARPHAGRDDVRLDHIVGFLADRAQRRGGTSVSIELTLEPTVVRGEADRVSRAVSNVVDNARNWSPPEGISEVTLHGGVLRVRDHRPGFDEQDPPTSSTASTGPTPPAASPARGSGWPSFVRLSPTTADRPGRPTPRAGAR